MKKQVPLVAVIAPALLILGAVGYLLLVKPTQDAAARIGDEVVQLQAKVDAARASRQQAPQATIRAADVFRLTKAMPDQEDMPGIMLEVNAVASAAGVEFRSISPAAPLPQSGYSAVPINLTFEGSYYDLTDFLFRVRNLVAVRDGKLHAQGRLFTLDSVDLVEATAGFPQIQAALTLTAYVYSTAPPAATGVSPTGTTTAPTGTTTTTPSTDGTALGG